MRFLTSRTMPKPTPPAKPTIEVVDPRWVLKAGAVVILVAFLCAYTVICALFYHSQAQLVLHPTRPITSTPGIPFTDLHFGVDTTGQPQLNGWWIPSDNPDNPTVLMLHSGEGNISDTLPQAINLHDANLNVLLFDYRGYGRSLGLNPSNATMQADAETALTYLTTTRAISPTAILVYGTGVGASLATNLCANHPNLPGLILESPTGDLEQQVRDDQRSTLIPMHLLFHERFPLAAPLSTLKTPKLILTYTTPHSDFNPRQAADPKLTTELNSPTNTEAIHTALRRFLDTYTPLLTTH